MEEAIDQLDHTCEQAVRIVEAAIRNPKLNDDQKINVRLTAARFLVITARQVLEGGTDGPVGSSIIVSHMARVQENLWEKTEVTTLVKNPVTNKFEVAA